ncbi:DMT family transporter [Silicimonas algicola]|nr:DMT family transporter [Silicimonas algicola]
MIEQSNRRGIVLMILTTLVFSAQDGISRHLAESYNTLMVVMIRYWFFAAFVILISTRKAGGVRAAAATSQPWLQGFRGVLLALEICVAVYGFTLVGLVESHAIFATYPLLITALAGPVLGEVAGWRRWLAILVGFAGMVIILDPGSGVFKPAAVVPFVSALMFALYGLLTRYAARRDSAATSFFWTGTTGAVAMTVIGLPAWTPMQGTDWLWISALCVTGATGHWLLIKTYEVAEASAVQPFAYFQLVFASTIGILLFGETLRTNVAVGTAIIVAAGIFTLWRAHVRARRGGRS